MISETLSNCAPPQYVSNMAGHLNLDSKKSYVPSSDVDKAMARLVSNATSGRKEEAYEGAIKNIRTKEKSQESSLLSVNAIVEDYSNSTLQGKF